MPSIEIKQLHNGSRFPTEGNKLFMLFLYAPFGLLLVLLRVVIFLPISLLCTILPETHFIHSVLRKLLCVTFGISIHVENFDKKEDVEVYVSNQVSVFDHLTLHSITGCVTPGTEKDSVLSTVFGVKYFGTLSNFDTFKSSLGQFIKDSKVPILFQPEATITNGKAVLKFNTWPFTVSNKVQPVAINIKRPFFDLSVSSIECSFWMDVLYFMFSPLTVYNVQFLPCVEKKGLSESDFAEKVQKDIARALKVEAVEYTVSDVKEWVKRYFKEVQRAQNVQRSPTYLHNPELQRMGLQVKEVLPMVPLNDILKDLAKTRNVDVTITNILEGIVPYTPEITASAPSTSTTSASNINSSCSYSNLGLYQTCSRDPFNTAAQTFGKSATERSLSFQERKQQLIDNARRRYIEKHGLNIVALNNC